MNKPRVITAAEFAKARNLEMGTELEGKVMWYDKRDALGLIRGSDGNDYLFSMGKPGTIAVSMPNYVTGSLGYVLEGELVKFIPVDGTACNIRGFLQRNVI